MLLQSIFAQLQSSKASYIDAKELVDMLDLRSHVQQDSLEFSKLLASYLEAVFSASNICSSLLKEFTEDYKGLFRYITTCCSCKTETFRDAEFAELEINIPVRLVSNISYLLG